MRLFIEGRTFLVGL